MADYLNREDLDIEGLAQRLLIDPDEARQLEAGALEPTAGQLHRLVSTGVLNGAPEVRCEHKASDGRGGGWHHHTGPHAWDGLANHGGQCPWEQALLNAARESAERDPSSLLSC
ncbi:hypothetical protein I8D64_11710 [Brachybacterium sp. MASK1Z-5]|uniref:Uncharacterized protein n=1 Tax=Brachybacterium halotolerans TaxID=2795215 RepID=A0ABS1BDJ4_9MICO|nr:hypothetical protein [Brachybacterium halotolerans]MBK0332065.1 hypothetical protein [Brachybacterium halotolerans]